MSIPPVSIIVTFHNCAAYLTKVNSCVNALKHQFLNNAEIILINDASTDETGIILDSFLDTNINVIHKSSLDSCSGVTLGIKAATGKYIGFVDYRNNILPELFDTLYTTAQANNADIVICGFYNAKDDNGIALLGGATLVTEEGIQNIISMLLYEKLPAILYNKLYRRELLINNDIKIPSDLNIHREILFNILAFKYANTVCIVNKPLFYSLVSTNYIDSYNKSLFDEIERLKARLNISCSYIQHRKVAVLSYKCIVNLLKICLNKAMHININAEFKDILKYNFIKKLLTEISIKSLYEARRCNKNFIKDIIILFALKYKILFILRQMLIK